MADNTLRTTKYGKIQGTSEGAVQIWYDVPYGKAPIGNLRWKAPEVPDAWDGIRDASVPGEDALQRTAKGAAGSEDCLKLVIYSRKGAVKRPVLVYIHGGNNQTGTSQELTGTELAADGSMVFVSLKYRLGLLGFFSLPSFSKENTYTGNFLLLDLARALDWIRENIEAFGGDSGNITLSGFSAGGRDVMAALISPLFKGKFQRAIAFSGGMTVADPETSMRTTAEYLAPLAVRDKKADTEAEAVEWLLSTENDVKEYLYTLSSEELSMLIGGANIRMAVFPHLFADGVSLPIRGFDTEDYTSVPLMMVTGTTEFKGFTDGDAYLNSDAMNDCTKEERSAAAAFASKYGSRMYRYFNTDASAERLAEYYHAPIYLCSINHGNEDSGSPNPIAGSSHGVFLPLLSSEHRKSGNAPEGFWKEDSYMELAALFQGYLKNFVCTGDPNRTWMDHLDEEISTLDMNQNSDVKAMLCPKAGRVQNVPEWRQWNADTRWSLVVDVKAEPDTGCKKALAEHRRYQDSYSAMIDDMKNDQSVSEELKNRMVRHVLNGRWFSTYLDENYSMERTRENHLSR